MRASPRVYSASWKLTAAMSEDGRRVRGGDWLARCYGHRVSSLLRQLLTVLIAFAMVGGTAGQLARATQSAPQASTLAMPCAMMMSTGDMTDDMPMMPCKGMTPDCVKQMCCVAGAVLPVPLLGAERAAPFSTVDYWSAWSRLSGTTCTPEPLPPRTI